MEKEDKPFFVILGPHSSGSSAIAGAIAQFDTFLGYDLFGYYGKAPYYGGEDHKLADELDKYIYVPDMKLHGDIDKLREYVLNYIKANKEYADAVNLVPVIKYPTLIAIADMLKGILGDSMKVIYCDRMLEKSIQSLSKRFPDVSYRDIEKHQAFLYVEGYKFLDTLPEEDKLIVNFGQLCDNREGNVDRIIDFMKLKPTDAQRLNAIYYIDDSKRHIK